MSNTIRIKRRASGDVGAPASMQNAELAFNEIGDVLYYGKGTAGAGGSATTVEAIGGKGAFVDKSSAQAISGVKTFSDSPIVPDPTDEGHAASKGYVDGKVPDVVAGSGIGVAVNGTQVTVSADATIARLASPALTGSPTAPTQAAADNSTNIATTAFVKAQGYLTSVPVTSVAGKTGAVTLAKADVGLGSVDNTADSAKNVLSATKLTTARSIGGVSFDGTANINLPGVNTTGTQNTTGSSASCTGNAATATKLATARSISIGGDATGTANFDGSANASITATLATSGVVAGTYTKLTVDAKGRATTGATASISDLSVPTADVSFNGKRITNLSEPFSEHDAATKGYVDYVAQGLTPKSSVKAATTTNIAALSGAMTVDGIALVAGNRILVKDQTTQSANGIYVVASGAWTRATDADTWDELVSAYVFVEQGTVNADNGFLCTIDQGGTLGTTIVTFVQFSGAGQITAGAGMTKTGNTLNVVTASSARIVVNADSIDLAATGVGTSTYKSVTVDVYGRVTAGSNPTTLAGYGITDAQAKDNTLTALAGVATSADKMIYATASDVFTTCTITSYGRSLIDDADAGAARTTLGLGTMATQAANNVAITGGSIDGITIDGGTF